MCYQIPYPPPSISYPPAFSKISVKFAYPESPYPRGPFQYFSIHWPSLCPLAVNLNLSLWYLGLSSISLPNYKTPLSWSHWIKSALPSLTDVRIISPLIPTKYVQKHFMQNVCLSNFGYYNLYYYCCNFILLLQFLKHFQLCLVWKIYHGEVISATALRHCISDSLITYLQ